MQQPAQYEKPKIVQKAPKRPDDDEDVSEERLREMKKDPFFKMMMDGPVKKQHPKENPDLFYIHVGQVNIGVPKTWKAYRDVSNSIGNDHYEDYMINGDKDAVLSFYYRGKRCNDYSGKAFLKTLKAPPHELTDDEFATLQEIMRVKNSKVFTKKSARTEDINGKRVLVVEGTQEKGKPEEKEEKSLFIDSDGTGTAVQEVFFLAPLNKYREHLAEVNKALSSINWY